MVHKLGRFVTASIFFCAALGVTAFFLLYASLSFVTVWLPFALVAAVGALLLLAPAQRRLVYGMWTAIASGVLALWMFSEPEVSFYEHHWLASVAAVLAGLCLLSFLFLLDPRTSDSRSLRAWSLFVVAMSLLIAYFSSPRGGSGGMIHLTMSWFGLSEANAETFVLIVRKCIHFTFYGVLGLVSYRWALACDAERRQAIAVGLSIALAHAAFDESRQTFFPNRTGSAWDVLLDMSGAAVFVGSAALGRQRSLARNAPSA